MRALLTRKSLLLPAGLLAIAGVAAGTRYALRQGPGQAVPWLSPINTPKYPATVGWINGEPVAREWLLQEEARLRWQSHAPSSEPLEHFAPQAKQVIEQQVLLRQEAARRGYTATAEEVLPAMRDVVASLDSLSPQGRAQVTELALGSYGDQTWSQWLDDPRVIRAYEDQRIIGKLLESLYTHAPGGATSDTAARRQAKDRLVAELRSRATIRWVVP